LLERDQDTLFYEHLMDGLLRGDIQTRFEAYVKAINNGIMNPNEARAKENMNPYKGGDTYWRPLNMTSVDDNGQDTGNDQAPTNALEPLWRDAIARVLRREANDVNGAAKRYLAKGQVKAYNTWLEQFYGVDHPAFVKKQFQPLVEAESRLFGFEDGGQLDGYMQRSLSDRQAEVLTLTAENLAASMDQYLADASQGIMAVLAGREIHIPAAQEEELANVE